MQQSTSPFYAEHYWYEAFTGQGLFNSGPAGFLLLFFICYVIYLAFGGYVSSLTSLCCKRLLLNELELDEDIDKY